jgi:hypothetical protein
MSLIAVWLASTEEKNKMVKKSIQILYYILTAVAIFLAIKDMSFLERTSTKVWVFLLSIFFPELFVILHGISTSSMGVNFFTGSPIEAHSHKFFMPKFHKTEKMSDAMMPDSTSSPLLFKDGHAPPPDSSSSLF